jgi:hypothetical protein
VHLSFSKLERILTLMIIKTKTFGIDKIQFKTYLNIIVSNVFLALKFISFKNMYLAKVIQVFVN